MGRLFDAGSFHHWLHSECFGLGFEAFRLGLGLEVLGLEFKVMALGFNVLGQWFGVQGPGFVVLGLGFTVLGTGFEGLGLGFDVGGCLRLLGLGFPNSWRNLEPQHQKWSRAQRFEPKCPNPSPNALSTCTKVLRGSLKSTHEMHVFVILSAGARCRRP